MNKNVDINQRKRAYTAAMTVLHLPAEDNVIAACLAFLECLENNDETNFRIQISEKNPDLPKSILISGSQNGFYMELAYRMDDFGWEHPLILANDQLSMDEAFEVLCSILVEQTDNIPLIFNHFQDVTSLIYNNIAAYELLLQMKNI